MIPDVAYIKRKFDEYNVLCFEGKLAPLPIRTFRSRRTLGQVRYRKHTEYGLFGLGRGRVVYTDFVFCISNLIDRPEEVVEDTILHEMIHYYILSNRLEDSSAHGQLFRSIMTRINREHGRHITITHRTTKQELEADTQRRRHVVCVSRFADGRIGVTVAMPSREAWLRRHMAHFPGVVEQQWVETTDPFFNRFPRSRTCRIYPVDRIPVPNDEMKRI